jgi:hypothetical protein
VVVVVNVNDHVLLLLLERFGYFGASPSLELSTFRANIADANEVWREQMVLAEVRDACVEPELETLVRAALLRLAPAPA